MIAGGSSSIVIRRYARRHLEILVSQRFPMRLQVLDTKSDLRILVGHAIFRYSVVLVVLVVARRCRRRLCPKGQRPQSW